LHGVRGHVLKAMLAMAQAVLSDTGKTLYQIKFAQMINHLEFHKITAETAVIRKAISICMGNPGIDHGAFSTAWHSLLLLEPVFIKFAALTQDGDFKAQADKVQIGELAEPLTEPFLLLGLKSLHAVDVRLERIMTFFRRFFLVRLDGYDADPFLPFLCALAEHCNLNEHVYSCTEEEWEKINALQENLDLPANVDANTMARIALISCYKDLMQLDCAGNIEESGSVSQNAAFRLLIKNTISIPARTMEYRETISVNSSRDFERNVVSSAVAKQYEENPYPRWRHLDIPVLTDTLRAKGQDRKILIAGCGTGHESLNMAVHYPEAHILGVDLSVSSLAYGKQKAVDLGIDNVEFMRADLLELEDLGQQFDLISCSGVLHHMEDPVAGWSKLLTCLKPDGFMKIALYSEIARQPVVACRKWIEEQGFAATPDGIRAFRQSIMDTDAADPLREIMDWTDFFSMSMCRDLVFHVQEQRVTLPWIKAALDDLGLCCLSLRISNPVYRKEYISMYPDDPELKNLDKLHEYEKHNPRTFRDMYSFWCCRKGGIAAERLPAWFYTAAL
jgi:ubiquinone/menaquinone biosynthesis C-methylase UbiE